MYSYIGDISKIAQNIILNYVKNKNIGVDCTLGNGHDSDFLKSNFKKVYSFDIQKSACEKYSNNNYDNVIVINNSHSEIIKFIEEKNVDAIMYNLGFLPGSSNKSITTTYDTTIKSIEEGLKILSPGGIMTICIYIGHDEGVKEESCIMEFVKKLPKNKFAVMEHKFLNRNNLAPKLIIIEKNNI
ncbi:tRNA (mnm(5)s(2)U34)-methyltransferase [Clostridium thermobutyricum]